MSRVRRMSSVSRVNDLYKSKHGVISGKVSRVRRVSSVSKVADIII